jgi:hypothetical protein
LKANVVLAICQQLLNGEKRPLLRNNSAQRIQAPQLFIAQHQIQSALLGQASIQPYHSAGFQVSVPQHLSTLSTMQNM